MLNYEYARLVEQDRRREIAARIRIERALHPEEPVSEHASGVERASSPRYPHDPERDDSGALNRS